VFEELAAEYVLAARDALWFDHLTDDPMQIPLVGIHTPRAGGEHESPALLGA
jgi:hypothetical protein